MTRRKRLESRTPLRARKPLQRRTPMRRAAPRRLERRAHLADHGAFVRAQPCISCGIQVSRMGTRIAAAHITLSRNEKGIGLKVRDEQRVPLCDGPNGCHKHWDQHRGKFAGWTDEQRYEIGTSWLHATLARWEAHRLTQAADEPEARAAS